MKFKCYLTHGMDGEIVETIATANSFEQCYKSVYKWKNKKLTKEKYRVEPYFRRITKDDKIIEDFGDYSYFLLYVNEAN